LGVRKWTEEDEDKMNNYSWPILRAVKILGTRKLKREIVLRL